MIDTLTSAIGGLGLFLLGMVVMTDGLSTLASEALRAALERFTRNPWSSAATGLVVTAILQSSSATLVMLVGFVSAELIDFGAAVGFVLGANLGTTATGWLVALLGFRLSLGTVALPLVFLGTVVKLAGGPKLGQAGYALAGFGLIFVGLNTLQTGLGGLTGLLSPDRLPPATALGLLELIGLGLGLTLVTQSSSAGVAATLTALHLGAVTFFQAAGLVVGMDVGTTITAVLAAVGRPLAAQRTAAANVVYNLWAALLGVLLLPVYTAAWGQVGGGLEHHGEVALVGFHTAFNVLGVATLLPVSQRFARLIEGLLPAPSEPGELDGELLDGALLEDTLPDGARLDDERG